MDQRILSKKDIEAIYEKWAQSYDFSLWFFYLLGLRINAYRKKAIEGLKLKTGDTVVDLGCGTGLNFKMLHPKVRPMGSMIGVDLSDAMLAQTRSRVKKSGWENLCLVQANMAEYQISEKADAILSTLAITICPGYGHIIKQASQTLAAGKRRSIFELQNPENWPDWVVKVMVTLLQSYGTRLAHPKRTPCNSMKSYFTHSEMQEYYLGSVCISTGVA